MAGIPSKTERRFRGFLVTRAFIVKEMAGFVKREGSGVQAACVAHFRPKIASCA
jgi:hypothetical protein